LLKGGQTSSRPSFLWYELVVTFKVFIFKYALFKTKVV